MQQKNGVYDVPRRGGALQWSLKYSRSNKVGCLRYKWNLDQSSCISATAHSRRAIFTSLKTIIGSTGIIYEMFRLLSTYLYSIVVSVKHLDSAFGKKN